MRIMLSQPSSSSLLLSSPETSSREGGDFAAIHNDDDDESSREQSQLPTTTTTTTQRRIASSSLSTLDSGGGCKNEAEETSEETLEGKRALLLLIDGDYKDHHCHHGTARTIGEEKQHHGATSSSSITTTSTRSDANNYKVGQVKNSSKGDDGGRTKHVNEGGGDEGRWNDWGGGDGDKEEKGKGGDNERSWSSSGAKSKFVGQQLLPRQRSNPMNAVVPPQEKETTTATITNDAGVVQLQDKDASNLDQEENQEEGEVGDVDGDDIAMGAPSSATTTTTTTTTTAASVKEEINMGDGKDRKDEEDDEENDEENDEEEYSNFMGMDLRRALPMLTESGSTVFDDTYCSSTLANTTYTTSSNTMVVVSCEDEEEDGREEDTTKYSCNESSSGISGRELRRVLPFVEEDDATYSLLDECAEGDFEVTSVWSAGAGASAAAAGTSSRAKVGDDMMMEARCGISSKNFVVAGVGRTGIVARDLNHGSNSSGRFASSLPSLMDRYSSLSASASTIAQPPALATMHQSHMPYSEDEDDDEVENGGEEEDEMREGDSPGHNYNSHTNIHTKVVRNDNDPLMATLSHAIESASINDVEYHQDGDKGDAYATKTRIANGGTTTTRRMMPFPQDHHHQNPHQQQERHLQIHHHHHQIHHHYHYRASPPHPVQSLPPPLTSLSTTSTLDITAYPLPPPHAIDVVGAGNQDTSINSKLMNNTIKIPVYDDMIVDLERINEEQSSGSVGGGTTATISSRSTNAASRGERRRRERLHQEEELSPAKMLYHPHEPAVLQQQQHQQLPLTSRTTPQLLADQQFFAYRHQYYMEQYHYYDDKKGLAAHGEGMGDIDTSHVSNSQVHNEHDHYDYDNDDDNKYEEETIHSTCSSVTLSQAFHPDGNDVSCSSSLTDEYYHLHPRPPTTDSSLPLQHDGASFGGGVSGVCSTTQRRRRTEIGRATSTISRESSSGSTLSSVTLSRALGRDVNRHEHEHPSSGGGGFYIATRLGDFVQQEEEEEALPSTTAITCHVEESKDEVDTRDGIVDIRAATTTIVKTSNSNNAAAQGKTPTRESPKKQRQHHNKYTSTTSHHQDDFEIETVLSDLSLAGSYKEGGVKNNTNIDDNDKKNINNGVSTQISSTLEEISTDILSSIMPECGVPIPSVMAKVGGRSRGYGMLLPWHSTRSIQNYHRSGSSSSRRVSKKRGGGGGSSDSSTASGRREGNIFSMSSVHTFRG